MAGMCVQKLPHDKCGSKDGLQVFEEDGEYNGFCFSCRTYVDDPYQDKPEGYKPPPAAEPADAEEQFEEIRSWGVRDLPKRALKAFALDYFGVKVAVSEEDGHTPTLTAFPFTVEGEEGVSAYKVKTPDKKQWAVGKFRGADLFGWEQAIRSGAKTLFITEGEEDAVALYQVMKQRSKGTDYEAWDPAIVSLPSGASCARKVLNRDAGRIRANFKEVVLVYDQDQPGRDAVKESMGVLPDAKSCGELPAKDANKCLMDGHSKALFAAVMFKNEKPKNTCLVDAKTLVAQARVAPVYGLSWPWPSMTKKTRGLRAGETIYIGAGVKMGKSTIANAIAAHLIWEHKVPCLMAKPEEDVAVSTKMLLGQRAHRIFHDPDIEFDYEAYDKAAEELNLNDYFLVDLYQHLTWDHLRSEILLAHSQGVRGVFIDPITNLTLGLSASEANSKLQEISANLSSLTKDLQLYTFIFCHLNPPKGGTPHEEGGRVHSYQFQGSRAMMRSCNKMLALEGNKAAEMPDDRLYRQLLIKEDREFNATGGAELLFNQQTGIYTETRLIV